MQRSWVLLPIAAAALLITQLDSPTLPAGYVDPVALAAATTTASWHCVLPHRARQVQARATGEPPLVVTDSDPAAHRGSDADPDTSTGTAAASPSPRRGITGAGFGAASRLRLAPQRRHDWRPRSPGIGRAWPRRPSLPGHNWRRACA